MMELGGSTLVSRDTYVAKVPKRKPSSLSISSTMSTSTLTSTASHNSSNQNDTPIDAEFNTQFPYILQRWLGECMSKEDHKFISKYILTLDQYTALTDEFNIGSGVELAANKLIFHEFPTKVHEQVARKFNNAIMRTYGDDDLVPNGSATIVFDDDGNGKQPDESFIPERLPAPSRQNRLRLQPNGDYYPTLVLEVAVSNEDRARLLDDACRKYFTDKTSVNAWVGIKIDKTVVGGEVFWIGWGRRKLVGVGLKLEQQSEDGMGQVAFLPVNLPVGVQNLMGQIQIPSRLIFEPNPIPAAAPANFTLPFELVRTWIEKGLR